MTKEQLRQKLKINHELREQFNFEVEERTAIMMEDGTMPEAQAKDAAVADVVKNWLERKP